MIKIQKSIKNVFISLTEIMFRIELVRTQVWNVCLILIHYMLITLDNYECIW